MLCRKAMYKCTELRLIALAIPVNKFNSKNLDQMLKKRDASK